MTIDDILSISTDVAECAVEKIKDELEEMNVGEALMILCIACDKLLGGIAASIKVDKKMVVEKFIEAMQVTINPEETNKK